jgi:purine-nucleoside phosphorylase
MVDLKESPTIGVICGSGLGDLAELLVDKQVVPYTKIPGFPQTSG